MNLFIGCSSSNDIQEKYLNDSKEFLNSLMKNNDLIFGASHKGIMGIAYNMTRNNNRKVIGICPKVYSDDLKYLECTEEILTDSISRRTDLLIEKSDAIIFLPGGVGTVYELLTTIECKRNYEFDKPIVIYNPFGFYDNLLNFLDSLYKEKFTSKKVRDCYFVSTNLEDTINYIKNYNNDIK